MRISSKYKVHNVADENIVLIQGRNPGDMTTVIALNDTSLFLWNRLEGRDFVPDDVTRLLVDNYEVDNATASADALKGVGMLQQNNILEP